jgi:hypothetical protein
MAFFMIEIPPHIIQKKKNSLSIFLIYQRLRLWFVFGSGERRWQGEGETPPPSHGMGNKIPKKTQIFFYL